MNIHSGGLMAYLNNKTQQQAAATNMNNDTQEGGITQIDVHNLVRNDRNFYGVRDIEALASMIAASDCYPDRRWEISDCCRRTPRFGHVASFRAR